MAFHFRQFSLEDQKSTMRVGTDAVLLGIWAESANDSRILEIGTGCGVIALLIAQHSPAEIDAIEIDQCSHDQARENFDKSPWKNRIRSHCISFQDYAISCKKKYDHIITNPPFFRRSLRSPISVRNIARHEEKLPFKDLLQYTSLLLSSSGKLSLVLPAKESADFIRLAAEKKLFPSRKTEVIPVTGKPANRVLLEFSRLNKGSIPSDSLTIRDSTQTYTCQYRNLTASYYSYLR